MFWPLILCVSVVQWRYFGTNLADDTAVYGTTFLDSALARQFKVRCFSPNSTYQRPRKQFATAFWPGANLRLRLDADSLRLFGEPAALPRPKYFLKFQTKSHHICPLIPIRLSIGSRSFGIFGFSRLPTRCRPVQLSSFR